MTRFLLTALWVASCSVCIADENSESPFGVSASAASTRNLDHWLGDVSHLGVHWLRAFDTFDHIEPKPGEWNWKDVDRILDVSERDHVQVSGLFLYGTPWIPSKSGLPTTDLPAWSKYVTAVVKHTHGRVKYWETWNEPPNFTHGATPAEYASLVSATYDAAHAADPTCHVGLCAQSVNLNYLDQALQAGAADHFDYIALHPYETLGCVNDGFESEFMSIVPTVRKMLAARDPARANAPVWFTELGAAIGQMNGKVKVTPELQAEMLVKAYTMSLAQGVARIDWFEGLDGDSGPMGLFAHPARENEGHLEVRQAATAMALMIRYLGHHPVYLGWELINERDTTFVFQGAENTVMITWAPPGTTDEIEVGEDVEVNNPSEDDELRGGTVNLTNAPVLIAGKLPPDFIAAAKANKDKPFPWGGDYSDAKTVSLSLGAPNIAKGLHQLFADTSSAAVMIEGRTARDCGRGAAQAFTVDPNFLSYTSTPIEITAVVRRNAAGDNAGFNLKYESASGTKSTGAWNTIPAGGQWSKLTWTITDPQFVGKWGFNFTFDSDSTQNSKYLLQSVRVTKK